MRECPQVPQGFCRMCAVYGGTYVLRRAPAYFLFNPARQGRFDGIICSEGQRFSAPVLVCSHAYLPPSLLEKDSSASDAHTASKELGVRHCVCITSGSAGAEGVALSVLPPGTCDNSCTIHVLQLDASAQATPPGSGKVVWHLWAAAPGPCDLRAAVNLLRRLSPATAVHWAAYYTALGSPLGASGDGPDAGAGAREVRPGLWTVPPPTTEVDSGDAVAAGEALFRALCGEEPPFLPAMPEPSDNEDPDSHAGVVLEEPSEQHEADLFGEQWRPAEEETVGAGSEAIDPPPSHSS